MVGIGSAHERDWLVGGGEFGALLRAFDWASTPLGPLSGWPQSLRTAVDLCLALPEPATVIWGPAHIQVYNAPYAATAPVLHPAMLGRSVLDNWPASRPILSAAIARLFAGDETLVSSAHRVIAAGPDGPEERQFTFTFAPIRDESGAVGGIFHRAIDTTAQWRAELGREAALRAAEAERERLRALFAQAPAAIAALRGPEHRYEVANPAYAALFGRQREYVGRTVREVFADVDRPDIWETLDRVYRSGEPLIGTEWPVLLDRRGDGTIEERFYNFVFQPTQDVTGSVDGVFIQALDSTEQVRARRGLEAERQRLLTILAQLPVGVIIAAAPSGELVLSNEQVERIWRHDFVPADEIAQYDRYRGFWADGRLYRAEEWPLARAIMTGEIVAAERIAFLRGDDTSGVMEVSAAPVRDEAGAIVAGVVIFADVSGRVEAEAERDRLLGAERAARAEAEEAVRARDTFLSIAAHELRTPVTALKGTAQLLLRRQEAARLDPKRLLSGLTTLERSAERLATLTDDLLDVARIRTGQLPLSPHPVDLRALIAGAIAQAYERAGEGHRLAPDLPATLPPVRADAGRIEQVLTNLLDNALKYSPAGGEIAVAARQDGDGVLVAVRDVGIGLPPGAAETIFAPFGRAANAAASALPGMGLGLFICRSIVERHGGWIRAASDGEGQGTTVTLWLPIAGPKDES